MLGHGLDDQLEKEPGELGKKKSSSYVIDSKLSWSNPTRECRHQLRGTNLQDIFDCRVLVALQVKGHPLSQLLVNSSEAVSFRLEHILHTDRKENYGKKNSYLVANK